MSRMIKFHQNVNRAGVKLLKMPVWEARGFMYKKDPVLSSRFASLARLQQQLDSCNAAEDVREDETELA